MRAKGIVLLLIINFILPMSSMADDKPHFEATFFDNNADGIDDRMNFLIEEKKDLAVIVMLSTPPSELHINYIENMDLEVTHIYKYINAIRIDYIPSSKSMN